MKRHKGGELCKLELAYLAIRVRDFEDERHWECLEASVVAEM
jgi:hypothetical protein